MKIRKVLLIDPPFVRFMGETQPYAPLGLAYLASVLASHGIDARIYNADLEWKKKTIESGKKFSDEFSVFQHYKAAVSDSAHPIYQETISVIKECQPDLIGMTLRTAKFFSTKKTIEIIKRYFPSLPILLGGNHLTADPEHSLTRTLADYGIRGEGEYSFYEFVKALESPTTDLSAVKGLSYRQNGKMIHNAPRELIRNLDELPFPNKHVILHHERMSPVHFGNILASRGCPFGCSFCDSRTTWGRHVRRRSASNIVDEMISLKTDFGTAFFTFNDDCFVTKKKDTEDLCDEIIRRGLVRLPKKEFRWWCEIHPSFISEDLVLKMKQAGCVAIAIGIESGSQRTLDRIRKFSSLDIVRRAAHTIKSCDVDLITFAMIGFPWETESDIQQTMDLIMELDPVNAQATVFTPLPGTEIFKQCEENGLINCDEDLLDLFYFRDTFLFNSNISEGKSREIIRNALQAIDVTIQRNRRVKIESLLETAVVAKTRNTTGRIIALNDSEREADVSITCEPVYAEGIIRIRLRCRNPEISSMDLAAIRSDTVRCLLDELPQYDRVEFEAEAEAKAGRP